MAEAVHAVANSIAGLESGSVKGKELVTVPGTQIQSDGMLKKSHAEFCFQDAQHCPVKDSYVCPACAEPFLQFPHNSQGGIHGANCDIPDRLLEEGYAKPFQAAISEAGLRGIMPCYCSVNGEPVSASEKILTGLLREPFPPAQDPRTSPLKFLTESSWNPE